MRLIPLLLFAALTSVANAASAQTCAAGWHADLGGKCVPTAPCPGGFIPGPHSRCAVVTPCAAGMIALQTGRCVAAPRCPGGFTPSPTGCAVAPRCADGAKPGLNEHCPTVQAAPRTF